MKLKYSKIKFKINGKKSNKRKKILETNKKYKIIGGMKYMIYDGKTNVFKYIGMIN